MHALILIPALLAQTPWKPLTAGVEYGQVSLGRAQAHVVRLDPNKARLGFALRSKEGGDPRPAATWATQHRFVATINAGMYATDFKTNVGYLVEGSHGNNRRLNAYQSALLFDPLEAGLPKAQMIDLDEPGGKDLVKRYRSGVQNLRLIKAPGVGVWSRNGRAWSEAAIAQDKDGRLLFIFTREGMEMAEWNRLLLASGLGVVRAMHVEGGPEASLSIHAGAFSRDFCGSYETGFLPSDENQRQRPIPNVIGVLAAPGE